MSSGPSITTSRYYRLSLGGSGVRIIGDETVASVVTTDYDDGGGERLDIFGDIFSDRLNAIENSPLNTFYVGKTQTPEEIVISYDGYEYLLTNNTYARNELIGVQRAPYTACYAIGTLIRTERGDVPVEALQVGERALTASGEARPIRWIGHRTMACRGRKDVMPVRIAAHAFGEGRPARDLLVSPAHAICVDLMGEVLIPACRLINGTTITQIDAETVIYWHVELDSHDILIAEGLPAESYLDCGNRRFFANAVVTDLGLMPDARPMGDLPFCRPFHEDGAVVKFVRARLDARARALGWQVIEETFGGLHLVADGRTIRPKTDGLTARFVLPTGPRDVRLVSAVSVPAHVVPGASDDRRLGVPLAALMINDDAIMVDDPRLDAGFHAVDGDGKGASWRWTDGAALLPASLFAACDGPVSLGVRLAGPALPRWIGPSERIEHAPLRLSA